MADNVKIRTEDVSEILDGKIKSTDPHAQLAVIAGEAYSSVLAKIAARSPTLDEKQALQNSELPSALNEVITKSALDTELAQRVPWRTIGLPGSGSDFEGTDELPFLAAFASGLKWFFVREGVFTFTAPLTIPAGFKVQGATAETTILQSSQSVGPTVYLAADTDLAYISVLQNDTTPGAKAVELSGSRVFIRYSLLQTADPSGITLSGGLSPVSSLSVFECAFITGQMLFDAACQLKDSRFIGAVWASPLATVAMSLDTADNILMIAGIFQGGQLVLTGCSNTRILGNHFNDGMTNNTPVASVLFRANTPASTNNENEDLTNLLQYLGSPSVTEVAPAYSNDFGGPVGENLTSRGSTLDILTQWRYEERNFQLLADEITTVTWNPSLGRLTTSSDLQVSSSHRQGNWILPAISNLSIPDGFALFYTLDRTLSTADVTLTAQLLPQGSVPIDRDNRQHYVLCFRVGSTLWWRGGNGSRFPGTGGQTGIYFVDGTSQSLLTYLGAVDYNDSDPNYSSNFSGVQGESLTVRASRLDALTKRLFEYTNLGMYVGPPSALSCEEDLGGAITLSLLGTLYISLPHVSGRITVAPTSWSMQPGQILYVEWNEGTLLASDQAAIGTFVVANGSLPLPANYPQAIRYQILARRDASTGLVYLWDNTELPIGGRWPTPRGRTVVRTGGPSVLLDNVEWDGTDLLWENLAVATATGTSLDRNALVDQTIPSPGLTNLASGEGLLITHSWNTGAPSNVTIEKVTLPLTGSPLRQNQFLWVQRISSDIVFSDY